MKSLDLNASELESFWADPDTDLNYVTPEEGAEILDRQARKYLGMSGEEFVRRYEAGDFEDPCDTNIARISMLIPLTRPK